MDIFHETLEKLNTTTTQNQKEKVETDLKKEIKKLQRLRDQIKGWQTLSEIKDKGPINEARRLIENEMERFKVLEKEMKIKAFSKEGLNQATKLDPKEKERMELGNWINEVVDKLNTGIDAFEAEGETIRLSAKKNKKLDSSKQERLDEIIKHIERHKYHVKKLELVLRLLENERLEVDDVSQIKDDIEYYIESHGEPDFVENDQVYDDLDLASSGSSDDEDFQDDLIDSPPTSPPVIKHSSPPPPPVPIQGVKKPAPQQNSNILSSSKTTLTAPTSTVPSTSAPPPPISVNPTPKVNGPSFASAASAATIPITPNIPMNQLLAGSVSINAPASLPTTPTHPNPLNFMTSGNMPSFAAAAKPLQDQSGSMASYASSNSNTGYEELLALLTSPPHQMASKSKAEILSILNTSYLNCPDGFEMESSRSFVPKHPVNLPDYYPPSQPAILENPAIFERLDLDTLFFIFYYQQRTYPQYHLA